MSVIALSHITKDYGGGHGVFDVSFAVEQGEVFGFLGPNGAGKTTTIRQLMGFLAPDSGTCTINGLDCRTQTAAIQKNMGYIPGEPALPDDIRGGEFIRFLAAYRGMRGTGRAGELCERFELDASGRIRRMSKGMKQKVAIVCALMHDPAVLILDEPTSGLDPLMQNRFIDLILEEKQRGKTVLMSSHMFEEVERTCDRVGILRGGRRGGDRHTEGASQPHLFRHAFHRMRGSFCGRARPAGAGCAGCTVTVRVRDGMSALTAAMARFPVTSIDSPRQSLEDVFLHYYGKEAQS
ncbi:MAG: ABC transporter ATP-binding protein [Ruthenibacterium lactatiformans]